MTSDDIDKTLLGKPIDHYRVNYALLPLAISAAAIRDDTSNLLDVIKAREILMIQIARQYPDLSIEAIRDIFADRPNRG